MMIPRFCNCLEVAFLQEVPEWHDCEYIRQRNELIPNAESEAKLMARTIDGEMDSNHFTYLFSTYMDTAAKKAKIV